jgi:hypothetical protein
MIYRILITGIGILLTVALIAMAHSTYTGYSGAPGSWGKCGDCHGSAGGTVELTGFPSQYSPGNTYTIAVSHNGGLPISGMNGSVRIGTGTENAGLIEAGTNTIVYNESVETNGIAMSGIDLENGTFEWTAPGVGTGDVTFYAAATQGGFDGVNTEITLVSTEGPVTCGDVNNDNGINILDVVYIINYKYKGGPAPNCPGSAK